MGQDHQPSLYGLPSPTQRGGTSVSEVQDSNPHGNQAFTVPPRAAYVHIPFCRRRCFYCDFPIQVTGDRRHGGNFQPIVAYLKTLAQEIQVTPVLGDPGTAPLQTVFFGGGTPSLLLPEQIAGILDQLRGRFGLAGMVECSIEVDPGTFSLAQLQGYQAAGVNRFSLGVQAFQDRLLEACGRFHRRADIEAAVALLDRAGIENWSLDLISGLPHQTQEDWQESLGRSIDLNPAHLSIYDLTLEAPTVFGKRYQPGQTPLPSEDLTAQFYCMAQETLTAAGYDHYEVSNYGKPGFYCGHNLVYWRNQSYYGFGLGAASYLNGHRFSRPRHSQAYRRWVEALVGFSANGQAFDTALEAPEPEASQPKAPEPKAPEPEISQPKGTEPESLTLNLGQIPWHLPPDTDWAALELDRFLDTLMLGLRLREGVSLSALAMQFGPERVAQLQRSVAGAIDRGWAEWVSVMSFAASSAERTPAECHEIWLRLRDPQGFLFSNQVISDLFATIDDAP